MDARAEKGFLEQVSQTYARGSKQDRVIRELIVRTFAPFCERDMRALQLGYSEGVDSRLLLEQVGALDVVEGAPDFAAAARAELPAASAVYEQLFEDFQLPEDAAPYDAVFAVYVLEHVADVPALLAMARRVLRPDGRLFVVVPNAHALSRQLAQRMGLMDEVFDLTENDRRHGHRRVYERATLDADLERAGFRTTDRGGVFLKILADFQLDQLYASGVLQAEQIEGLYQLGQDYPDLCGSLWSVARPGDAV